MRVNGIYSRCRWCVWALLLIGFAPDWAHAQTVNLEAMLIHASNQSAAPDGRVSRVEPQLRRVFQFSHYRQIGSTRQTLGLPSQNRINLGHGYTLNLNTSDQGGRVRAEVEWYQGGTRLLSTSVTQQRGVPAILGGPPYQEGTLILILEFR
jgi:hypothetical protein